MITTPYTPKDKLANGRSPGENGAALPLEAESEAGRYVPEELYWSDYYDRGDISYEWNNGYLEEKPVGDYAQFCLYVWFLGLIKDYLHVNPIGRMVGLEIGFRMVLPHKVVIRKPDLALVVNSNPVPLRDKDRSYRGIFDLCIESISDSRKGEVERDTVVKQQEYAAAGVREYFIIDERQKETAFYELSPSGVYMPIQPLQGVIRSHVLPGFQFRETDLYRLPEPPSLITDSVYQHFASPFVRAERLRAEAERDRAQQEYQRAETAIQQAEQERRRADTAAQRATQAEAQAARYAAMLKALGVAVDEP